MNATAPHPIPPPITEVAPRAVEPDDRAGEIDFPAREFHLPVREISFLSGKVDLPVGKVDFPVRKVNFLSREVDFSVRKVDFLIGETSFSTEKTDFLVREVDFLGREINLLLRKVDFLTQKVDFSVREVDFLSRKTDFREPNAYFQALPTGHTGRHSAVRFYEGGSMKDTTFGDKINQCEVTIQNIQDAIPGIPGGEAHFAGIRQRVDALRAAQENVQMLRGKLTDAVIVRRQQNKEASKGFRNLAAVARAHFGFANPVLESFNIRSEHRAKRGRKPKVKPAPEV